MNACAAEMFCVSELTVLQTPTLIDDAMLDAALLTMLTALCSNQISPNACLHTHLLGPCKSLTHVTEPALAHLLTGPTSRQRRATGPVWMLLRTSRCSDAAAGSMQPLTNLRSQLQENETGKCLKQCDMM
jgi:hypothetical protein